MERSGGLISTQASLAATATIAGRNCSSDPHSNAFAHQNTYKIS